MREKRAIVLLLYLLLPWSVWAIPPVILLGAEAGNIRVTDSDGESNYFPFFSGNISGTYRTALDRGGYFAGSLRTGLRYFTGGNEEVEDRHLLRAQLGLPVQTHRLELNARLDSSFHNAGRGYFVEPAWSADFLFGVDSDALVPRAGYFGSYRHQEDALDDRIVHGALVGFDRDRSIYLGWGLEALGAWEYYPDWMVLDSDGNTSKIAREDVRLELAGTMEGLIGFFHSWDTRVTAGMLLSNENAWDAASESRALSGISGTLQLSPHRNIGIEGVLEVSNDYYLDREIDGDRVNRFGTGSSLRFDYTPDGALFFVLDAAGGWNWSVDPRLEGWYATVSGGIEYSF